MNVAPFENGLRINVGPSPLVKPARPSAAQTLRKQSIADRYFMPAAGVNASVWSFDLITDNQKHPLQ